MQSCACQSEGSYSSLRWSRSCPYVLGREEYPDASDDALDEILHESILVGVVGEVIAQVLLAVMTSGGRSPAAPSWSAPIVFDRELRQLCKLDDGWSCVIATILLNIDLFPLDDVGRYSWTIKGLVSWRQNYFAAKKL